MTSNLKWWHENAYGILPEDWGAMIKSRSQGNDGFVYDKLVQYNLLDKDEEIVGELDLLNLARSGKYNKAEIDEIRRGPKLVYYDEKTNKYLPIE